MWLKFRIIVYLIEYTRGRAVVFMLWLYYGLFVDLSDLFTQILQKVTSLALGPGLVSN